MTDAATDRQRTSSERPETRDGTVTTGRPLDSSGDPVSGPALELDPSGRAAELFRESPHPLVSDPASRTWAVLLETAEDGETDRPVLLQWLGPGAAAPPVHVHPDTETFHAIEGELTVVIEGDVTTLGPGESATVQPGEEHTFRNDTERVVAFRAELPSMRTVEGLYAIWGSTHEEAREAGAGRPEEFEEPGAIQALLLSEEIYPDTELRVAPLTLQRLLWWTVGRVARSLGHTGVEERFLEDDFWRTHVEQPRFADQR